MPIIRSAIKKVRKDKKRTKINKKRENALKSLIKKARIEKSAQSLKEAYSALDKAVKVNLIHTNKAARLKSKLAKLSKSAPSVKGVKKPSKRKSNPRR